MKKSTFLFSLLLSVTTLGLHAQKPESGTYTISNVSFSEVTLADNQFLGIGAKNDDGTYQTYSMQMKQPGTSTVFDVYAKLDEMLVALANKVRSDVHTGDYLSQATVPDLLTMVQLISEGYTKINVETTGTADADGNPIVRFKVGVPTIPNFVDNSFMTVMGATGARYSALGRVYLWEYALNALAEAFESDPVGLNIVQNVKSQIKPYTYLVSQNHWSDDWALTKCRNYYIAAQEDGSISFIRESAVNESNKNSTLWTLNGTSQDDIYLSGNYYILNKGNQKYINYNGNDIAQPDLSELSSDTQDEATTSLGLGRIREGNNVYQIDNFAVNGKSIFDYIENTLGPDDTTIKNYTKTAIRGNNLFYPRFRDNYGYIMGYETVVIADWYIKKFGKIKMQDNGDGTVYFYFDVPAMPFTTSFLEGIGSASLWQTLTSAALAEITDGTERAYAGEQLDKLTPPVPTNNTLVPPTRYYIVANGTEFDFVTADQLATAGDYAKWMLGPADIAELAGYYRVENVTTSNVLELLGEDATTIQASSDEEDCVTNASTIFNVDLTPNGIDYQVSSMRSQGIDFISDLNNILSILAESAHLEDVPSVHIRPTAPHADTYVAYFDVPKMTDLQLRAVITFVVNEAADPDATEAFFANVQPNKRYSIAQIPGQTTLIAVEGDIPADNNVWKLKEIDNKAEYFALEFPAKVSSTEDGITYYYCTLNTDFPYTIPETSQIVGAYVVPTITKGIAHPELIGGPGIQIPANTPVILESLSTEITDNIVNIIPEVTESIEMPNNYLIGTLLAEPVEANGRSRSNIRVFNISSKGVVGFYKYTGDILVKNKGFLDLSTVTDELVNTYAMSFDEMGPTGIENIDVEETVGSDEIYDIQGRKVNNPTKGLYIINGKKVLVR